MTHHHHSGEMPARSFIFACSPPHPLLRDLLRALAFYKFIISLPRRNNSQGTIINCRLSNIERLSPCAATDSLSIYASSLTEAVINNFYMYAWEERARVINWNNYLYGPTSLGTESGNKLFSGRPFVLGR